MHLDGVRAHFFRHFRREQLGHRRFLQARQARILHGCRVAYQLARRFDLRRHVGQAELHGLVFIDGLAETFPFARVAQRCLIRGARHAHGLRGDADASPFQAGQGDLVALSLFANQIFRRDAAVVEEDLRRVRRMLAHLLFQSRHDVARRVRRHPEGADAALAGRLVGDGHDDGDVRILAAGNELFRAVDHVVIAIARGRRAQGRGVAARVRFRQAKCAQHRALRQRAQPLFLLRIVGVHHGDAADGAIVDGDDGRGAAIAGGDFFQHQGQRYVVEAGATERFGHGHAKGAQRGQFLQFFLGEMMFLVPAGRVGRQALARKTAQRFLDHRLFFIEYHGTSSRLFLWCVGNYQPMGLPS